MSLRRTIRRYGLLRTADRTITQIYRRTVGRFYLYSLHRKSYGLLEAIFFPRSSDVFLRYSRAAERARAYSPATVLEIGAGSSDIGKFLGDDTTVVRLDADFNRLKQRKSISVAADAANLPFADKAFDAIIALDTLEHIPIDKRIGVLKEMCRSARRGVLHFPLPAAERYDKRFARIYRFFYHRDEPNTAEHLKQPYPDETLIKKIFPDAIITPSIEGRLWLMSIVAQNTPIIGFAGGLCYIILRFVRKRWGNDFWGAFVEWNDENRKT